MKIKHLVLTVVTTTSLFNYACSYAAPMTNLYCNPSRESLVQGYDVVAGADKAGVFIPIPTDCTVDQVCKISVQIEGDGIDPHSQNNNAYTTLINRKPVASTEFYAYSDGQSTSGQCVFKQANFLATEGTLKVLASIATGERQSAQWLKEHEHVVFN